MNIDTKFYRKVLQQRLPFMTALLLLFSGLGVAFAVKLPTTYTTSARLLVEAPQISDVGANGTTDGSELLEVIQQRLMTRANLIDIASQFEVLGAAEQSPDEVVENMRKQTEITRIAGRGRATLMIVEFNAEDPQATAGVVNQYVTLILRENSRLRSNRAEVTLDFFEQQVDRLSNELSLQSNKIISFKSENADALPDGMEYRLNRQALLQERLARAERERATLQDQRTNIVRIYETTGRLQAEPTARLSPQEAKLEAMRNELNTSLSVYSETNPRVKSLRAQIAQQEAVVAAERGGQAAPEEPSQKSLLDVTLAQIDSNITAHDDEIEELNAELGRLANAIARTPSNGIALDALERDLNNYQNQYNEAVNRRNQAQMGEQIEVSSRGQRISVLEQASIPTEPSSPNRPMIAAAGVGTGLLTAIGLFVLLELLSTTVRRPVELVSKLGITPIGSIPYMESTVHRRVRRVALVVSFLAVVIGVPLMLWAIDTYYLPLTFIMERLLDKTGLG